MKWRAAIESELQKLQLLLPFAEEKTIDMRRCCSILHVNPWVVRRLACTEMVAGATCLIAYNTMPRAPLRIDYDSLVHFLDHLRTKHGIRDRRPPKVFGRYRDEHLLPFPWSDTIDVDAAASALNIHRSKVLLRIEAGQFEAYQLAVGSPWRVSHSSLAEVISRFGSNRPSARPYGASKLMKEEAR